MDKITKTASPALRNEEGQWIVEHSSKAELFAMTFAARWTLPCAVENEFAPVPRVETEDGFLVPRARKAEAVLAGLRVDSATGPDLLP
eukprot:12163630-Alexandrium_andersonii.AAC.1